MPEHPLRFILGMTLILGRWQVTSSTGPTGSSDTEHSLGLASATFAVWRADQNLFVQHLLDSPKALNKPMGSNLVVSVVWQ